MVLSRGIKLIRLGKFTRGGRFNAGVLWEAGNVRRVKIINGMDEGWVMGECYIGMGGERLRGVLGLNWIEVCPIGR